ncbi:Myb/SANT-like DNA-binding domain protein [Rhynchospora pubera]|uniref:Myb/SANT-like DNA-binding domain protein n=1 Tax=Rhynchospora pubera TaxID=906938 RepID=A0AAV8HNA7_9POAL|nr:Myb/SANT-like DNA-binding domain protein [Rhynchospora pubera]KAJ4815048.1 Myb/SANT-like DNA-binding domain protein [Rhynchospora pubera]KAJ4816055.1 Myb/SANT-like DNA-binding domain protein [Rhynchospora pubera]KAJ4817746.1 Myb/SANT-like DNA-binding domain protein [Rhynchospora pubera]KAJ4820450.1 Myb/SANT-like DNA-binding domain protein [Rhynchospora pubera]
MFVDFSFTMMKTAATSKEEPLIWNYEMDKYLIDALLDQWKIGNRVKGTFTSKAYDNIVKELSQKFQGRKFDKGRVKNRVKYIKKGFGPCYDIFKNGLSGFNWNPELNMWCAESGAWDELLKNRPEAATWRDKPIYHYQKLLILYGADRAIGDESETPQEMRERIRSEQEEIHNNTIDEIDRMVFNDEATLEGYDTPMNANTPVQNQADGSSCSKRAKRKISMEEDIDSLKESVQAISDVIVKTAAELVKPQEVRQMSKSEILNLLVELDLNASEMDRAYIFLIKNPDMLDGIITYPTDRRRNLLIEMMK